MSRVLADKLVMGMDHILSLEFAPAAVELYSFLQLEAVGEATVQELPFRGELRDKGSGDRVNAHQVLVLRAMLEGVFQVAMANDAVLAVWRFDGEDYPVNLGAGNVRTSRPSARGSAALVGEGTTVGISWGVGVGCGVAVGSGVGVGVGSGKGVGADSTTAGEGVGCGVTGATETGVGSSMGTSGLAVLGMGASVAVGSVDSPGTVCMSGSTEGWGGNGVHPSASARSSARINHAHSAELWT